MLNYDRVGPHVDLEPRPFKITPCARVEYGTKTKRKLMELGNGGFNAKHVADCTFDIRLVRN